MKRVLEGQIGDGVTLLTPEREAGRVSGTFKLVGQTVEKRNAAGAGETVGRFGSGAGGRGRLDLGLGRGQRRDRKSVV